MPRGRMRSLYGVLSQNVGRMPSSVISARSPFSHQDLVSSCHGLGEALEHFRKHPSFRNLVMLHDSSTALTVRVWEAFELMFGRDAHPASKAIKSVTEPLGSFNEVVTRQFMRTRRYKAVIRKWAAVDLDNLFVAEADAQQLLRLTRRHEGGRVPEYSGGGGLAGHGRTAMLSTKYSHLTRYPSSGPILFEPFISAKADYVWHTHRGGEPSLSDLKASYIIPIMTITPPGNKQAIYLSFRGKTYPVKILPKRK